MTAGPYDSEVCFHQVPVKISFCLFTYNQAQFVREAIQSAFSQDYSPLEIVIVDDGSTDDTAKIIRSEVAAYKGPHEIKLLLKETNQGLADSVNVAIYDLSQGEWLVFAAGDDVSCSDRVSKVACLAISESSFTVMQTGVTRIDEAGKVLDEISPSDISLAGSAVDSVLGAAAAYHRASIAYFHRIGRDIMREDVVLTTRALLMGNLGRIEDRAVCWRRHENNLSGRIGRDFLTRTAFARGIFLRHKSVALAQQLSDIAYVTTQGRLEADEGMRLMTLFARELKRQSRMTGFFMSLTDTKNFRAQFRRHPVNTAFGVLLLGVIFLREKISKVRRDYAR